MKEKICFVIMPFGGWFDNYYSDIYIPAIADSDLKPVRADNLYTPGSIINDIWRFTQEAEIILADLTGKNPNVFYELGLAHAIAKPAILITQSMEDVPFDLRGLRIIVYDKNVHNWGELLKIKISNAISETLNSPLKSVLPTFIDLKPSKKQNLTEFDKEMLDLKQDVELLKREVIFKEGISQSSSSLAIRLTNRELEVINLIAKGLTQREVSEQLFISPKTVEAHVRNLIEKMDVKNTVELVAMLHKNNIIK
ncbi:response regulator transcription factor [uncultured Winogradskyella sp.]|uniref:response regulator transcription factor n=1 Tax=uncultured Winogradskyella sp. TaxID=395353 RepID=UPI0026285367|nr:response regulator transcription factor [uncultured Winogradskyella sp.]